MPVATGSKQKKGSPNRKGLKFPEGAPEELEKCSTAKLTCPQSVIQLADELMTSPWHAHSARPSRDVTGYYAILRWFAKETAWVPLYVGSGRVCSKLDAHFSGKEASAIGKYLSSFPRHARNIVWLKWLRLPAPLQEVSVDQLTQAVAVLYNNDQLPAFNAEAVVEKELPADFSIVPGYSKPATKGKARNR